MSPVSSVDPDMENWRNSRREIKNHKTLNRNEREAGIKYVWGQEYGLR